MLVIYRAAIVRVNQREIPDFGSLIKIRHAGRSDLQERLRERVEETGARRRLLELREVGEEAIAFARLKYFRDERSDRRVVGLVRVNPARVYLGFLQGLVHVVLNSCDELPVLALVHL